MRACNGSLSHAVRHSRGVHRLTAPACGEQFAAFRIVDRVARASEPVDWSVICLVLYVIHHTSYASPGGASVRL